MPAHHRAGTLALLAALLIGVAVRCRGLEAQAMLLWDEGLFTTGARFLAWRCHTPSAPPQEYEGYPVFNEKPLHVLLLAAASEVLGHTPSTGRWLSAAFAAATLALVGLRLRRLPEAGPWPAVAGTLALAGSTYHAYYSRLGLHEVDSVFWLLLGCVVAAKARGIGLAALAGILGGLCLGSSYRWLPLLPLLGLRCALGGPDIGPPADGPTPDGHTPDGHTPDGHTRTRARQAGPLRMMVHRAIGFLAGVGIVALGCEMLYRWTFGAGFTVFQPPSYFQALQSKFTRETHFTLEDWDFFLRLIYALDGPLLLIGIVGIGVVAAATRKDLAGAAGRGTPRPCKAPATLLGLEILGLTLLPLVLFSISEAKVSRAVSVICPWMALGIGLAVHRLQRWKPLFCAAALAAGLYGGLQASALPERLRSSFPEALQFAATRGGRHLSSEAPISAAVLGRRAVVWADLPTRALPATADELQRAVGEGARLLILDWEKYLWYNRLLANLERSLVPVLVLDNPCARFPALLNESYLPRDAEALRQQAADLDKVLVYELKGPP